MDFNNIGVNIRQGPLLSSCLFNMFPEKITYCALEGFKLSFPVCSIKIRTMRLADDIVFIGLINERERERERGERGRERGM